MRDTLIAPAAPEGWGLACFQGGEVLLQRHPKPLHGPLDFYKAAKDLRTDYIVGHVADPGTPAKLESTQPYRFRSWVYAQSGGSTPALVGLSSPTLEHVPDFLRRNIRAHTAAEHVFHVVLAFLHDAGKLDDMNIRVADAAGALRGALSLAERLADGDGGLSLNAIITNGRLMFCVRGGARPMWIRQVSGVVDCRVCGEALPDNERRDRRRTSHEHVRAVIVASEPDTIGPEGWEEVPEASIVSVTRELSRSILPLRPDA